MEPCTCYAVITDPARKALFAGIFPDDHVPITPKEGTGKTDGGEQFDFWLIDTKRTTFEQEEKVIDAICKKFGMKPEEVFRTWTSNGMPVKKEGAEFHFCNNHLRWGDNAFSLRGFI
jgi:hypothetical protein